MAVLCSDAKRGTKTTEELGGAQAAAGGTRRLDRAMGFARISVGLVLFAVVVAAVVHSWDDVRPTLGRVSLWEILLAGVLVLVGLAASVLTWRVALHELGSTVRIDAAAKIYLLGQLGKYLPGSVWALAAQMELAKQAGVPRLRGLSASIAALGVNVVTGLAIGLALLPSVVDSGHWSAILIVSAAIICALALSPPVLNRLINVGLRAVRRPSVQRSVSWGGIARATLWSIASWGSYGLSVWILAVAVGAPAGESLPLCLAGMALAMTLGFLIVVAPSGIGVREAVLVAALAPVLDRPEALAVALVARLLFTVADLVAAAVVVAVRIRPS